MKKYKIPFSKPSLDKEELSAVDGVITSGWISEGKKVEKFEKEFARFVGVRYAIAVTNGTSALHAAISSLNLEQNSKVAVPSLSFISTSNVLIYQSLLPIFSDVNTKTLNITFKHIDKNKNIRAVIIMHYGGNPVEADEIIQYANNNNIFVVEDAAGAIGSVHKNKICGSIGDLGCFSFYPNKIITTGEGGMVTTDDKRIAERIRIIRDYGQDKRYHHVVIGYNYHMTDIQAVIGLEQLKKIKDFLKKRRKIAKTYSEELSGVKGLSIQEITQNSKPCFNFFTIIIEKNRDHVRKILEKKKIDTRVCFPPLHLQPLYQKIIGMRKIKLPNTEKLYRQILNLPIYPDLTDEELNFVIDNIKRAIKHG